MKMIYVETNPKGFVRFVGGKNGTDEIVMHTGIAVDVPAWLSAKLVKNPAFCVADEREPEETGEEAELEVATEAEGYSETLAVAPRRRGRPPKAK